MTVEWRTWEELDVDLLYAILALRQRVFVLEQRCFYLDADGLDPGALHLMGWDGGTLVAYLRAFPPAEGRPMRLGRIVTAPEVRGAGLGRQITREGLRGLRGRCGPGPVRIEAQAHLVDFYASLGFAVVGPVYDEDGIPHIPMVAVSE